MYRVQKRRTFQVRDYAPEVHGTNAALRCIRLTSVRTAGCVALTPSPTA